MTTQETLSPDGRRLLYSFEGLKEKTPDGRYKAYLCPAGRPTIYAGCTKGVYLGLVITAEEGERRVDAELTETVAAIEALVKAPMNAHERDAFILLTYNIGIEGFHRSSVLARFNKGDKIGASRGFGLWNKAHVGGRLQELHGLTSRRAREAALFLKPVEQPAEPYMPQAVVQSKEPASHAATAVKAAAGGVGIVETCKGYVHDTLAWLGLGDVVTIPDDLPGRALGFLQTSPAVKATGATLWTSVAHSPLVVLSLLAFLAAIWGGPIYRKLRGA